MKVLITLNDAPYGSERSYNGLRLAGALAKREGVKVSVFLVGDAAACAKSGQKVPEGFYSIQHMLGMVTGRGGTVGVCGTCMDARGIAAGDLMPGAHRSSLDELTQWTAWADKALVF